MGMFDLDGRIALVTGSSRGIGRALAEGLARAGARVVVNARSTNDVERAVAELRDAGLAAEGCVFDVTDADAVESAIEQIEANLGPIGICVNNAGIQRRIPLHELPVTGWDEILRANLTSAYLVGSAVARRMIPRGEGKIVNVCSIMSALGRPTTGAYTASKGGLKLLTQGMCADWARFGIQANAIGPGYVATELTKALIDDETFSTWVTTRTPAGRWGQTADLVGATILLSSPASNYINGQIIYIDGGLTAVV